VRYNIDRKIIILSKEIKKKSPYKVSTQIHECNCLYRITTATKVQTEIIAKFTVSQIGKEVILVIMYVKIFKTDIIVFIDNVILYLTKQ
jgi:hypothetical protein